MKRNDRTSAALPPGAASDEPPLRGSLLLRAFGLCQGPYRIVLDRSEFLRTPLTLHLVDADDADAPTNSVDGDSVPARHFGVVLDMPDWQSLATRLEEAAGEFLISPRIRFQGEVGEQATLFITDPSGNALEFKSFTDPTQLFAT